MELMYPIAIILCFIIAIAIFLINFKKKKKYLDGKKVANTKYIKETEYYKTKVKTYQLLSKVIKILYVLCIIISSILIARPVVIQTRSEDIYNRDILLSIDLSGSQDEVNLELVKQFRNLVPKLEGDRIGIVIFNTCPVVYCPLTEDHEYIDECLEYMQKQLQIEIDNDGYISVTSEDAADTLSFFNGGVIANNDERGSSLVGDGLARNNLCFS